MTWYKTTRPNGRSFHSDNVVYKTGKRVRPESHNERRKLCGPGVLHASPSAPEAARYARWPYVLWQVEGKPFIHDSDKSGFKHLTVVRQLDEEECFGPEGKHVIALLRRIEQVTKKEAKQLSVVSYAASDAAWYVAWHAASDAASDAAWNAAGAGAWNAAGDAARELAVRDLIGKHGFTQVHYDELTGPWRSVIGPVHPEDA